MMNLAQAGKYLGISRQAVRVAIFSKKLEAVKVSNRWAITTIDLDIYKQNKFKREFCKIDGEPLYDKSKGEYSISEAAEILGCPKQHLYYAVHTNKIKTSRKRKSWIILLNDIIAYKEIMILQKKKGS